MKDRLINKDNSCSGQFSNSNSLIIFSPEKPQSTVVLK